MPAICSILTESKVAVTPMKEGLRFAGTMEIGGLDTSINQSRVNGIKKSIPKYFPEFKIDDFSEIDIWSGFRPVSPDGLPYIGRSGTCNNLTVATGHGMMGMSMGPVTGKLISEIIDQKEPEINIEALAIQRF
jgi:D-amino-acid dehydrogenase